MYGTSVSWNPASGCTKVSPGCDNCYVETFMRGRNHPFKVTYNYDSQCRNGKVAVCTKTDLFHEDIPDDFIDWVFETLRRRWGTYYLLTKRPERLLAWKIPSNVWVGVSVETQEYAEQRVPVLMEVEGYKFVAIEPMLGYVDLSKWLEDINMVVCGGEMGKNARPMHESWPASVLRQCYVSGTPFVFNGWGSWAPLAYLAGTNRYHITKVLDGTVSYMAKVGTKVIRTLEGQEWPLSRL